MGALRVRCVAAILALLSLSAEIATARQPASAKSSASPREGVFAYVDDGGVTHLSNVPGDERDAPGYHLLVEASPGSSGLASLPAGAAPSYPSHPEWRTWVEQAGHQYDLEPALLYAVMWSESGFNPRAVSQKGARGLMQLMPATADQYGVRDAFDPKDSIFASAHHLRGLIDGYRGDLSLALAAYNAGSAAVSKYHGLIPPYPETQAYVPHVLDLYRRFQGAASAANR